MAHDETLIPEIPLAGGKDALFAGDAYPRPFAFTADVAAVFDDMADRSIPHYRDVIRLVAAWAQKTLADAPIDEPPPVIYDLGCSTGTMLAVLAPVLAPRAQLVGVDRSEAMLAQARTKLATAARRHGVSLRAEDLETTPVAAASFVIMQYTLQFIPVARRQALLARIVRGSRPGAWLALSEKVRSPAGECQDVLTQLYHEFKERQGYSPREIAQKREALENVLVPLTAAEQEAMLRRAGFAHVECVFRWNNFATFLAQVPR